jgi:hypothetical protein
MHLPAKKYEYKTIISELEIDVLLFIKLYGREMSLTGME